MILLETLTTTQKVQLMNGNSVGIFDELITSFDPFYDLKVPMCLGYYMGHSGYRTISPMYSRFIEMVKENDEVTDTADNIISRYIRDKFIKKWILEYNLLADNAYNPLEEYYESESREQAVAETRGYDSAEERTGTDTDTHSYVLNGSTETTVKKKEVTTREGEIDDSTYGFNSSLAVPKDKSENSATITVEGDPAENIATGSESKASTDTLTKGINNKTEHTGEDTVARNDTTETERSGRRTSGADLVERELDLRSKQIFFDIVFKDIDSILTIPIYERGE